MFWAAASPAGWPPPQHRAAAPQNTTDSHSETLCIELFADLSILPRRVYESQGGFFPSLDMGLAGGLR